MLAQQDLLGGGVCCVTPSERNATICRPTRLGSRRRRTIANSHRYYWTNPQGQIVGTDTDATPGPTYRPLRIVTP